MGLFSDFFTHVKFRSRLEGGEGGRTFLWESLKLNHLWRVTGKNWRGKHSNTSLSFFAAVVPEVAALRVGLSISVLNITGFTDVFTRPLFMCRVSSFAMGEKDPVKPTFFAAFPLFPLQNKTHGT